MQCTCGVAARGTDVRHKLSCALVQALTGKLSRNVRGLGHARIPKDLYETPIDCATRICRRLAPLLLLAFPDDYNGRRSGPPRIIEPSAGTGNFVRAIRATWPNAIILANDIFPENALKLHAAGATSYTTGKWEEQYEVMDADLIVGNPPFSLAEEHVKHSLSLMHEGAHLAFLLPMSFVTTQGRCERLWVPNSDDGIHGCGQLRYLFALAERPPFAYGKTDMVEYGVYVWQKGWKGNAELLAPLWWRQEAA